MKKHAPKAKVKAIKMAAKAAKPAFKRGPKKPENDDLPRKFEPDGHMPKQQAKTNARKSLMRRLGSRGI